MHRTTLQWGRNFIVAETSHDKRDKPVRLHASMGPQLYRCGNFVMSGSVTLAVKSLQWGRNFIVAETSRSLWVWAPRVCCFNGAATLSLRKHRRGRHPCRRHQASMGPQLYRCGNCDPTDDHGGAAPASMGPQLYRCGNFKKPLGLGAARMLLQWGRNFIVAETPTRAPPLPSASIFNGAATLSLRKL